MYITKYGCVFLKLGESIYVAMDISILFGSLPVAHNAQHSLVGASVSEALSCGLDGLAVTIYRYIDVRTFTVTAHARRYAQT